MSDDNIIEFPDLKNKRYVLGCPQCDGTSWTIVLSDDQVRFEMESVDGELLDVTFTPDEVPVVCAECQSCGHVLDLNATAPSVH